MLGIPIRNQVEGASGYPLVSDLTRHLLVTIVTSVVTFRHLLVTFVTFVDAASTLLTNVNCLDTYWQSTLENHLRNFDRRHWLNAGQL